MEAVKHAKIRADRAAIHAGLGRRAFRWIVSGRHSAQSNESQNPGIPGARGNKMLIILIIVLLLVFGGGGGYFGYSRWGAGGGAGIGLGTVLVIVLVCYLLGAFR